MRNQAVLRSPVTKGNRAVDAPLRPQLAERFGGALGNQLALKLREDRGHARHRPALRGAQVEPVSNRDQANRPVRETLQDSQGFGGITTQAVKSNNDHCIYARAACIKKRRDLCTPWAVSKGQGARHATVLHDVHEGGACGFAPRLDASPLGIEAHALASLLHRRASNISDNS